METKNNKNLQNSQVDLRPPSDRTVGWFGGVNYENLSRVLTEIKRLVALDPDAEIKLMVNSYGGTTGIGMSFYDIIRSVIKPNLSTVGSGDVDSSAVLIFLAGEKRFLTNHTTLLFHLASRTFEQAKRVSSADMENFLKEDRLKDYQYACVVSDSTDGKQTPEKILDLMMKNTLLTADEAVNMGFAHKII